MNRQHGPGGIALKVKVCYSTYFTCDMILFQVLMVVGLVCSSSQQFYNDILIILWCVMMFLVSTNQVILVNCI